MAWLPHEHAYVTALLGLVNQRAAPLPPLEGLQERILDALDRPDRGIDTKKANRAQMAHGADPGVRWVTYERRQNGPGRTRRS